jgi:outer membrane cobalamin receptor
MISARPRLFAAILLFAVPFSAAQAPGDEKVVVTANAYPVPFENLSRSVTVLTREDIAKLPGRSIPDVLALATSADIRSRAPFGMQSDLSLRGSAFSQVLVLVDGLRMNDSQTGHHNADIPVPLQDIDRIEVLLGPGSSIYGADALGGIINIITSRQAEPVRASVSAGQHGLLDGSFAMSFEKGKVEQSISASGNRASGFVYDRDFRSVSVSSRTRFGERFSVFVSHINKEFGANGFYGPSPSKEWTNQTLLSVDHTYRSRKGTVAGAQIYYRTHGDRFLYDIRSPGLFESNHRTHAVGLVAKARYRLGDFGSATIGGEAGRDWIQSDNLGHHAYVRTSLFGEMEWTIGKSAVVYPGFRFDYYSTFRSAVNPSLSGSWWVAPRVRLRSSIGHAFRVPTFTELYYRDPNNQASSSLNPESSWSAEMGADFIPAKDWLGTATFFGRREREVIDWIRQSPQEKWRTANIGKLNSRGFEISLQRSLDSRMQVTARYSRVSMDPGQILFSSKYVLDYARDSWSASASASLPLALAARQTIFYKRRADGRHYWVLDSSIEHRFGRIIAALECRNLLDSRYQEISGVDMPGRWLMLNLRTR